MRQQSTLSESLASHSSARLSLARTPLVGRLPAHRHSTVPHIYANHESTDDEVDEDEENYDGVGTAGWKRKYSEWALQEGSFLLFFLFEYILACFRRRFMEGRKWKHG